MFAEYFKIETSRLADSCLDEIETLDDWNAKKDLYRKQLHEMLGLDPLPERTPLQATITGTVQHEEFEVRNLHFQSSPGLYVTGNLYVPKNLTEPAPTILYVCGHGRVKIDGIDYGNKTYYQHHGAWFARNGYVCLVIDTIQLGELSGIHHGTYRHGMWWWNSRGYTPAGVEAWNCIRALDYLTSLDVVDKNRLGVTGRSGGGAYSWWIATLDERIKAAAPVAGITDLQNHIVDGVVEGHCDCMYHVNTYGWDFAQVAALVAPRPLLILNTDDDGIFPLDGVNRLFKKVRRIYELHGKKKQPRPCHHPRWPRRLARITRAGVQLVQQTSQGQKRFDRQTGNQAFPATATQGVRQRSERRANHNHSRHVLTDRHRRPQGQGPRNYGGFALENLWWLAQARRQVAARKGLGHRTQRRASRCL